MTSNQTFLDNPADWLVDTVRRRPEAVLLMAAGCALLMRNGARSSARTHFQGGHFQGGHQGPEGSRQHGGVADAARRAADTVSDTASDIGERIAGTAGDLRDRVSETASTYASTAADYADQARQRLVAGSEQVSRQAQSAMRSATETFREQPLLVAALGLAAGAAVASLFPPTDIERRTLGDTAHAMRDAAERARENVTQAAGQTMQHLKDDAARRGMSPEGLQQMAREATETFSTAVSGQENQARLAQNDMAPKVRTSG